MRPPLDTDQASVDDPERRGDKSDGVMKLFSCSQLSYYNADDEDTDIEVNRSWVEARMGPGAASWANMDNIWDQFPSDGSRDMFMQHYSYSSQSGSFADHRYGSEADLQAMMTLSSDYQSEETSFDSSFDREFDSFLSPNEEKTGFLSGIRGLICQVGQSDLAYAIDMKRHDFVASLMSEDPVDFKRTELSVITEGVNESCSRSQRANIDSDTFSIDACPTEDSEDPKDAEEFDLEGVDAPVVKEEMREDGIETSDIPAVVMFGEAFNANKYLDYLDPNRKESVDELIDHVAQLKDGLSESEGTEEVEIVNLSPVYTGSEITIEDFASYSEKSFVIADENDENDANYLYVSAPSSRQNTSNKLLIEMPPPKENPSGLLDGGLGVELYDDVLGECQNFEIRLKQDEKSMSIPKPKNMQTFASANRDENECSQMSCTLSAKSKAEIDELVFDIDKYLAYLSPNSSVEDPADDCNFDEENMKLAFELSSTFEDELDIENYLRRLDDELLQI